MVALGLERRPGHGQRPLLDKVVNRSVGVNVCYQDAWEAAHRGEPEERTGDTFTRRNPLVARGEMPLEPGRRIDYILLRCSDHGPMLEVRSCERVFDQPERVGQPGNEVWASDHFGVLA